MTILTATSAGTMTGYFDVPAGVPAGVKDVKFYGATASGTTATATFIGRGVVTVRELQLVTTQRLAASWQLGGLGGDGPSNVIDASVIIPTIDPVAQTFTPAADFMMAGVDLKFAAGGTSNIVCQIRECSNGFPTAHTVTDSLLTQAQISTVTSVWSRFDMTPTLLQAGHEYAVVVLCDDATTAVRIATLGDFDAFNQQWITEQAYQVGVLLKSSNARTWTADQTSDLAFRLLQPTYTPVNTATSLVTHAITMTSISATSADYLIVMAAVERPATGTDCVFEIKTYPTTATTNIYSVTEGQPLLLATQYSGKVDCTAVLTGTEHASPILYKDMALVAGKGRTSGTYISRAIPCNATSASSSWMTVNLTASLPQGSDLDVRAQVGTDASNQPVWSTSFVSAGTPVALGDGWYDRIYSLSGFSVSETRIKLTLTGSPQALPQVRDLQAYCVAVP